jgi:hypothetical protein
VARVLSACSRRRRATGGLIADLPGGRGGRGGVGVGTTWLDSHSISAARSRTMAGGAHLLADAAATSRALSADLGAPPTTRQKNRSWRSAAA